VRRRSHDETRVAPRLHTLPSISLKRALGFGFSVLALGVTLAAMVLSIVTAVVADHTGLRFLFAVAACGFAMSTAVKLVALRQAVRDWRSAKSSY
jgi:hypothetical protein